MTKTIRLTDEEVRLAIAQYIERQLPDDEGILREDICFLAELGYNGEMGGTPTRTKVEVLVETMSGG